MTSASCTLHQPPHQSQESRESRPTPTNHNTNYTHSTNHNTNGPSPHNTNQPYSITTPITHKVLTSSPNTGPRSKDPSQDDGECLTTPSGILVACSLQCPALRLTGGAPVLPLIVHGWIAMVVGLWATTTPDISPPTHGVSTAAKPRRG
jgi:hypothetical protein